VRPGHGCPRSAAGTVSSLLIALGAQILGSPSPSNACSLFEACKALKHSEIRREGSLDDWVVHSSPSSFESVVHADCLRAFYLEPGRGVSHHGMKLALSYQVQRSSGETLRAAKTGTRSPWLEELRSVG